MPKNIYQKIWENNLVKNLDQSNDLIYVDLQLLHEVTSPQAFDGLKASQLPLRQKNKNFATVDHNVPTQNRHLELNDKIAKLQLETLAKNCKEHDIRLLDLNDPDQGIVHIIGPELGLTQPGMVIVCGDSHTSTHGAFGALAFGIGTSEVEHVLATQTLIQAPAKTMSINFKGKLSAGVYPKDMILALIGKIGTAGGTGYVFEYKGEAVDNLSLEGRMTLCNMTIEAGARAGLVNPDYKTIEYLKGRRYAPSAEQFSQASQHWLSLASDQGASYDKSIELDVSQLKPQVTWGTSPEQVVSIDQAVPKASDYQESTADACLRALDYMGLKGGEKITDLELDRVFIGSCTNARIEDLRVVAQIVKGRKVHPSVDALIVPGSGGVKRQAEAEGLAEIFKEAGFSWRDPGCSMCLGMNEDILQPHQRCASTSNRNFEGRQGKNGRTHLVSPAIAAASALRGKISQLDQI